MSMTTKQWLGAVSGVGAIFGLVTGGFTVYGFVSDHLAEKHQLRFDVARLKEKVCDIDPETFWYKGDCLDKGDFSRPELPG